MVRDSCQSECRLRLGSHDKIMIRQQLKEAERWPTVVQQYEEDSWPERDFWRLTARSWMISPPVERDGTLTIPSTTPLGKEATTQFY